MTRWWRREGAGQAVRIVAVAVVVLTAIYRAPSLVFVLPTTVCLFFARSGGTFMSFSRHTDCRPRDCRTNVLIRHQSDRQL